MTTRKIKEIIKTDIGVVPAEATAGIISRVFFDMSHSERVAAIALTYLSNTRNVVVGLRQATDAAGSGAKLLGTAVTVTNASGIKREVIARAEAHISDFDVANGFTYVGVNVDTSESVYASAVIIRTTNTFADGIAQGTSGASGTTTTVAPTTTGA